MHHGQGTLHHPLKHEHILETVQRRLDEDLQAMRRRRDGRTLFRHPQDANGRDALLMKTLPNVASGMALSVLSYNLTCVINIVGIKRLIAAIRARRDSIFAAADVPTRTVASSIVSSRLSVVITSPGRTSAQS